MKKTLTINLNGAVYHIDDDAYRMLDRYLSDLRIYFRKQREGEEVIEDIEARVGELFSEQLRTSGTQVITLRNVEDVISRIGKPEEFASAKTKTDDFDTYSAHAGTTRSYRRLYRNPDDKILGGVLSGISAYLGWDPTWLRILMFALALFGVGSPIIIYLILWLLIPQAYTAEEKLAMRGEPINMENIGKTVRDGYDQVRYGLNDYMESGKPQSFLERLGEVLISVIKVVVKFFFIILLIACCPAILGLLFGLFVLVLALVMVLFGSTAFLYSWWPAVDWEVLSGSTTGIFFTILSAILVVGIPLVGVIYAVLRRWLKWEPLNNTTRWTLAIVWIVSLFIGILLILKGGWLALAETGCIHW